MDLQERVRDSFRGRDVSTLPSLHQGHRSALLDRTLEQSALTVFRGPFLVIENV